MPRLLAATALIFALFALPACGAGGGTDDGVITGKVYFEGGKVDLPKDTVLRVRLLGPRQADGPVPILGEHVVRDPESLPFRFRISYDSSLIDEDEEYNLIAAVQSLAGRGLLYLSDDAPVLTGGHPFDRDIEVYELGRPK